MEKSVRASRARNYGRILAIERSSHCDPDAGTQLYSITLRARIVLGRQRHARLPITNAMPRDEFAGLYECAISRNIFSSRDRDACRPVVTGFCVALSGISSIGLLSIRDLTHDQPSRRDSSGAARAPPFVVCSGSPARDNPQTAVKSGRCPFASGTPAILGAHNSEPRMQQPDHQSLV